MRGVVALGIVGGGIAIASLFGRAERTDQAGEKTSAGPAMLRRRIETDGTAPTRTTDETSLGDSLPVVSLSRPPASDPIAVSPEATRAGNPPPILQKTFPAFETAAAMPNQGPAGPSTSISNGGARHSRTHIIVNGDTLPAIAERYLGASNRADEIFAANRGVLPSPDALLIGVELTIPASDPATAPDQRAAQPAAVPATPRPSGG